MKILIVQNEEVLLDDYDWLRFCRMKWKIRTPKDSNLKYICCNRTFTINGEKKRKTIYLHRAVMCPPYGLDLPKEIEVHHKNGPLDNRKEMLEKLTKDEHNRITNNKWL